MSCFVTGATGFIGRYLVAELLERGGPVYVLVRAGSRERLAEAMGFWGPRARQVTPIAGDLAEPGLGIAAGSVSQLCGRIRHVFHLGALYDLDASDAALERANVLGTRHALDFAAAVQAGCFHLASSIAVAGRYRGTFTEEMFAEAEGLDHPYFRTKHASEAMVRAERRFPWRIYRPGMVVGHSRTGHIDKIDGPYYLFKPIQKLRRMLPEWVPLLGFEGGHVNVVPVDYVAAAMARLAELPGEDGRVFHLTDPRDRRVGETVNLFARAAHAPTMALRLDPALLGGLPQLADAALGALPPLRRALEELLRDAGVPQSLPAMLDLPTVFDSRRTQALLAGSGIAVPRLEDYAWRLWDYWERHLDPELFVDRSLRGAVEGRTVLITGGSSGIGRATALRLAEAGAKLVIVARDPEKLEAVRAEIAARGGQVWTYRCDIADTADCERLIAAVLAGHGGVDTLINNAGRSIRRAIENSYGRFHDYERLMRLNYFAAVRLTLGLLPSMVARGGGHVVSISSIGVLSNEPRFSAYVASKAALEAFSHSAGAEYRDRGVRFTVINMPLVRTPMVAPTRIYEQLPLITPEEAADLVCEALIHRPRRLATRLGVFAQLMNLFAPRVSELVMSEAFGLFPESEAAGGARDAPPSKEMIAFASILKGIHW